MCNAYVQNLWEKQVCGMAAKSTLSAPVIR